MKKILKTERVLSSPGESEALSTMIGLTFLKYEMLQHFDATFTYL